MKPLKSLCHISLIVYSSLFFLLSCSGASKEQVPQTASSIPIVYSAHYKISLLGLEKLHPFDIGKYDKIYNQLRTDNFIDSNALHKPLKLTDEQLKLIHSEDYLNNLKDPKKVARYLEAPMLKKVPKELMRTHIVDRFKLASGGTIKAAELALADGYAINLGGGYHHAKPTTGEGFCIIADVPIAIKHLQKEGKIKRALIIDTDVHQGNGTIACLPNDPTTFTFSMHQGNIYPIPKEKGDKDIELQAGMGDKEYLAILERELPKLFKNAKPDIVFHVAGCDALNGDPLAHLKMTHEGIAKRDLMIAKACHKYQVPYVMTLSGGYSKGAWKAQYKGIVAVIKWAKTNPIKK